MGGGVNKILASMILYDNPTPRPFTHSPTHVDLYICMYICTSCEFNVYSRSLVHGCCCKYLSGALYLMKLVCAHPIWMKRRLRMWK